MVGIFQTIIRYIIIYLISNFQIFLFIHIKFNKIQSAIGKSCITNCTNIFKYKLILNGQKCLTIPFFLFQNSLISLNCLLFLDSRIDKIEFGCLYFQDSHTFLKTLFILIRNIRAGFVQEGVVLGLLDFMVLVKIEFDSAVFS